MPVRRRTLVAAGVALAAGCARGGEQPGRTDTAGPQASAVPASAEPRVTERGIGALQAGMTVAEAQAALGGALVLPRDAATAECTYATWRGGPPGVGVMLAGGRVARVDVREAGVRTAAGVGVGDPEDEVRRRYGARAAAAPRKYEPGQTITVVDAADSTFALVFETGAGKVARYRAGRRPEVAYVEGCG